MVPQKLKILLPYDLAISLLAIHPKEMKARLQRDICTPLFIAALFTVARDGSSPYIFEDWMNKPNVVYTHSEILFSLKKKGNSVTCCKMDKH